MSQVCSKCSFANPPDAMYCYFDGVVLGGRSANGRPIQAGAQPFPTPFVFPSGQACHNFDQLAMACQQDWACAVDLLKQGFLASFLSGIGRADLSLAAKEASRFPDPERGLDRLLAKIPSQVLEAPKLRAEPTDVSLGVIPIGTNRNFELHLSNLGMRLLYGSVSSDCKWLTLGDAPGNPQKLFQFGGDVVVHVQIRGKNLRAGSKPLEGHLVIESNGGMATVTIRAEVPIKPYPNGVFAGAVTPRQVAEKAIAAPKEAAPLFESGAVAKWFVSNGWTYPVQGPSASGVGSLQQFFEALGLSKAPKVEINQTTIALSGKVGQSLQTALELKTQEKRPIYGHAVCDQPWLEVGKAALTGRSAVIQVAVPRVPNRPGETLQALVTVTSNGNQKFKVAVSLEIAGTAVYQLRETEPASAGPQTIPVVRAIAVPARSGQMSAQAIIVAPTVADAVAADPTIPIAEAVVVDDDDRIRPLPSKSRLLAPPAPPPSPITAVFHAAPASLLLLLLMVVIGRDIIFAPASQPADGAIIVDPNPRIAVHFDREISDTKSTGSAMRFGLMTMPADKSQTSKKLTYDQFGRTNSTMLKIGDQTRFFGFADGVECKWVTKATEIKGGQKSVWLFQSSQNPGEKLQVTQLVEVVPGEPIELKSGNLKRYFDTCQVRYQLENTGQKPTRVGLRILIDTLIGEDAANDGVPFTVPGVKGLVNTSANFQAPNAIPDFLQVLEFPDLKHPGIVGFMNFKLGEGVEPPGRVLLTHWTEQQAVWDIPELPIANDSAVVLYWPEKTLAPGGKRQVGFSYGLGSLAISGGRLGISVGGNFVVNGDLTVVALVNNPEKGQTLVLELPAGLEIVEGGAKQSVPLVAPGAAAQQSPVTWRIRATRDGTFDIEVRSSTGVSQKKKVTIKAKSIF